MIKDGEGLMFGNFSIFFPELAQDKEVFVYLLFQGVTAEQVKATFHLTDNPYRRGQLSHLISFVIVWRHLLDAAQ